MGSRAIVIACKNDDTPRIRFGVPESDSRSVPGIVYTRTGRPFFTDPSLERALLQRLRDAATRSGLWDELNTDWLCLDCELMPWSAKAQALIREQYAAVGSAAIAGLTATAEELQRTVARLPDAATLLGEIGPRLDLARKYTDSYRRYLEHTFREVFKLQGTPLRIQFNVSENPFADRKPPEKNRRKPKPEEKPKPKAGARVKVKLEAASKAKPGAKPKAKSIPA